MNFIFKNEVIDYNYFGKGTETILFLHGWGGNKISFISTIELLKNRYKILAITMPTINPTNTTWNLFDFANLTSQILKIHNINSATIICHSFGFRVAIILKQIFNIKKIIITGGAGPKKQSTIKKINTQNNKVLNTIKPKKFSLKNFESPDYKTLSPTNKETFKNIVNFNLIKRIKFNCPILLFWGKNDLDTKLWIAKLIKKHNIAELIPTVGDHFAYLKLNSLFNHEVKNFLEKEFVL